MVVIQLPAKVFADNFCQNIRNVSAGHGHVMLKTILANIGKERPQVGDLTHGKPKAVIAKTIKGKGVSFIEGQPSWHHRIPSDEELPQAMEELKC